MKPRHPENPDEVRMSFGDHLEELRSRLIKAIIGLAVGTTVCTIFASDIFEFLTKAYITMMTSHHRVAKMVSLDPTEIFFQYFQIALIFGIGLSAPYAIYQLWQFVASGLYPHERRWVTLFAPASMCLFFLGVLFLIKVVLPGTLFFLGYTPTWIPHAHNLAPELNAKVTATQPMTLPVLAENPRSTQDGQAWITSRDGALNWVAGGKTLHLYGTPADADELVEPLYSLSNYLDFVTGMSLAFGLGFQIPIVVVLLVMIGIVSTKQLAGMRKVIILLIVIAGAVLTPSGDPSSQLLLAVPMFLLFEVGVFCARRVERRRASQT